MINKNISRFLILLMLLSSGTDAQIFINKNSNESIYHNGWIDLNKNGQKDIYENPSYDIEERISDLLQQMTINEKTVQMVTLYGFGRVLKDELPTKEWKDKVWKDGIGNIDEHLNGLDIPNCLTKYSWPASLHAKAINEVQKFFIEETRLGIPVDFTNEGIRGICSEGGTNFPAQIGIGSTWDVELVDSIGHITGREGRALGYTNIYSPILDIARDPRWGRTVETYGEDPFLVSTFGYTQVKALQSEGVASTPKHFAIYSIPKGGRDGLARTDPKTTPREVEYMYLTPFRKTIKDAGALGVMSSYNDYDGIPITMSRYFLTEVLRDKWRFKGYVVSDSRAVQFIHSKHHVAPTYKEAVKYTVEAGLNIRTSFTEPDFYLEPLRELVNEGAINIKTIDDRVRDVLRVKFLLGLFDQPYVSNPARADEIVASAKHQAVALRASRESIILLKNENNLLPFGNQIKSILVTGPNAAAVKYSLSRYGPSKVNVSSVLEGIKGIAPKNIEIKYAKGCKIVDQGWPQNEVLPDPLTEEEKTEIQKSVELAKTVDAVVVVLGGSEKTVGESLSRTSLDLPGRQLCLLKAVYQTGKPVVLVLINGRPITINWADKYVPAIVEAWFPGSWGGQAVAEVLFGLYNPGGKLSVTFPKTVGQIPLNFPYKRGSQSGIPNYVGKGARVAGSLYPFGYGLSYTSFQYDDLKIVPVNQNKNGNIQISFTVKNIGGRDGDEVVQLYLSDVYSSVTTYEKVLRGFERIHLKQNESKRVIFQLHPEDLALVGIDMNWVVEPGKFEVFIGSSSQDIRLKGDFFIDE